MRLRISSCVVVSMLWCASAWGASFYVDGAVASSGNGTSWGSAWKSFDDIDWGALAPGDTVFISGGTTSQTYHETLDVQASGADGAPLTFAASTDPDHDGEVVIEGDHETRESGVVVSGVHDVIVRGLTIRGGTRGVFVHCDRGRVHHVTLEALEINNYYGHAGVIMNGYCGSPDDLTQVQYITVRNSTISSVPDYPGQTDNIYASVASDLLIEHNVLTQNNQDAGGSMDNLQFYIVGNAVVRNNVMIQHGVHGDQCMILDVRGTDNTLDVYNNVAVHTGNGSVYINRKYDDIGDPTVRIYSNTFVAASQENLYLNMVALEKPAILKNNIIARLAGDRGGHIVASGTAAGMSVDDVTGSLFYDVADCVGFGGDWTGNGQELSNFCWDDWTTTLGGTGINADPGFLSPETFDYRVDPTSEAIDHGLALEAAYASDLQGTYRPQGPGWDIGAYELGESCTGGATRSCYTGPVTTEGVGACHGGDQACAGDIWGPCEGQVLPADEITNGVDDDCDGEVDEGAPDAGSGNGDGGGGGDGDGGGGGGGAGADDGGGCGCQTSRSGGRGAFVVVGLFLLLSIRPRRQRSTRRLT